MGESMYMTCFLSIKLLFLYIHLSPSCFGAFLLLVSFPASALHPRIFPNYIQIYSTPIFVLFHVGVLLLRIEDERKGLIVGFLGFLEMGFYDDQRVV